MFENPAELTLDKIRRDHARKVFFADSLQEPLFHWFFIQGQEALDASLYIPGVSSLLNGIEASLRVTISQLEHSSADPNFELSPYQTLSNTLLRKALKFGLPVETLAFPTESDFLDVIEQKSPNAVVVQLRHDICHGNIIDFVASVEALDIQFFRPENLLSTALTLMSVCYGWAHSLAEFRNKHHLRNPNAPIPEIPKLLIANN